MTIFPIYAVDLLKSWVGDFFYRFRYFNTGFPLTIFMNSSNLIDRTKYRVRFSRNHPLPYTKGINLGILV